MEITRPKYIVTRVSGTVFILPAAAVFCVGTHTRPNQVVIKIANIFSGNDIFERPDHIIAEIPAVQTGISPNSAVAVSNVPQFVLKNIITDLAGCSDVFLGGCVTYACAAKEKLVGVSHETLEKYGAVSEQTAREMARGVRLALGADVGIATTGIAGPGGGTPEQPVGTVYIAVSTAEGEKVKLLTLSSKRSREFIRICAATNAMSLALNT